MVNTESICGVIERRTLHDEVVDRMRDMIIEGHLDADTRINETELCRHLGVSRTPVREAIKTLASEGLIILVRNKGAVVRRLGTVEIYDMMETVAVIERYAAEVGVERAGDDEISQIAALHNQMCALFNGGDRLAYYKHNQAIHTALVALAHNKALSETHESLQMKLRRMRYVGNEQRAAWSGAMREHEQIIRALKRRDSDALRTAVEAHLSRTQSRLIAYLQTSRDEHAPPT
ncbi:MAG: GntR family transcriptional regulator [Hyphomicrobiaceae bacterium]